MISLPQAPVYTLFLEMMQIHFDQFNGQQQGGSQDTQRESDS